MDTNRKRGHVDDSILPLLKKYHPILPCISKDLLQVIIQFYLAKQRTPSSDSVIIQFKIPLICKTWGSVFKQEKELIKSRMLHSIKERPSYYLLLIAFHLLKIDAIHKLRLYYWHTFTPQHCGENYDFSWEGGLKLEVDTVYNDETHYSEPLRNMGWEQKGTYVFIWSEGNCFHTFVEKMAQTLKPDKTWKDVGARNRIGN